MFTREGAPNGGYATPILASRLRLNEAQISPAHSYFTVHLPKLLLSSLPLSVIGLLADPRMRTLLIPCIAFVALLSCLGHKEWRFVVYVVPLWNIVAARGATWLCVCIYVYGFNMLNSSWLVSLSVWISETPSCLAGFGNLFSWDFSVLIC